MKLKDRLSMYGRLLLEEPMKLHTTYKIGGPVRYYIYPKDLQAFMRIIEILQEENVHWHVLGRGSNVLVDDGRFDGAIINLDRTLNDYYFEPEGHLLAQAGCSLISLSVEAMKHSLSGLEFAAGIPGSLGGGLYMNAGAYRSELADILEEVLVCRDRRLEWVAKEELDYRYRHSAFQDHKDWIIVAGRFALQPKERSEIRSLMENRQQRRLESQPLSLPSCGSTFRNPAEMPAWQLIDRLGFRGLQVGGARVSDKHSNFIVNMGDATAEDVSRLIETIRVAARDRFGIELIPEVERLSWGC